MRKKNNGREEIIRETMDLRENMVRFEMSIHVNWNRINEKILNPEMHSWFFTTTRIKRTL